MLLRFLIFLVNLMSAFDSQPEERDRDGHDGQPRPPHLGHEDDKQRAHPQDDVRRAEDIVESARQLPYRVAADPVDQFPGIVVLHMPIFQRRPFLNDSGAVCEFQAHGHFQVYVAHELPVQVVVGHYGDQAQQGRGDGRLPCLSREDVQGGVDEGRRGEHLQ